MGVQIVLGIKGVNWKKWRKRVWKMAICRFVGAATSLGTVAISVSHRWWFLEIWGREVMTGYINQAWSSLKA